MRERAAPAEAKVDPDHPPTGAGRVELLGAFGGMLHGVGRPWPWKWVFPATRPCREPTPGDRYRHHLHETALQRAFQNATRVPNLHERARCQTLRHRGSSARSGRLSLKFRPELQLRQDGHPPGACTRGARPVQGETVDWEGPAPQVKPIVLDGRRVG
jgi:hypothetical protein